MLEIENNKSALVYMLEKLQKEITSKVVVVLEGGYNLDNIPLVAEGLFRCLKGESFPNLASSNQICSQYYFKNQFKIIKSQYQLAENVISVWSKYWPILNEEALIEESKKFVQWQNSGITGGHKEKLILKKDYFLKGMINSIHLQNELFVYAFIHKYFPKLKKFIPEFKGLVFYDKNPSELDKGNIWKYLLYCVMSTRRSVDNIITK